jgi:hypothetical protein
MRYINTAALAFMLSAQQSLYAGESSISGEAEFKYLTNKTGSTTKSYGTAEVNLNIDVINDDGIMFKSEFRVYDGVQADANASNVTNMEATEVYALIPVINPYTKVILGLAQDNPFGPKTFDDGGRFWKSTIAGAISKNLKGVFLYKKGLEFQQDDEKGDVDGFVWRLYSSIGGFRVGYQGAVGTYYKDMPYEQDKILTNFFADGNIGEYHLQTEYYKESQDFEGEGIFAHVDRQAGRLNVGLSYLKVKGGLDSGEEFKLSEIFDGDTMTLGSSLTKDSCAIALPISYAYNEKLNLGVTLAKVEIFEEDANEIDMSLNYKYGKQTSISAAYAAAKGDGLKALTDDGKDTLTHMNIKVAFSF